MAKDITIAGAIFNSVPSIEIPTAQGGTARYTDTSATTALAGDVAAGKVYYDASGIETIGTASGSVSVEALSVTANGTYTAPEGKAYSPVTVDVSGGGGASNVVSGTFKGTTSGVSMDVDVPYTGTGFPVALYIFPVDGIKGNATLGTLKRDKAVCDFWLQKNYANVAPTYSGGDDDEVRLLCRYKDGSRSATSYEGQQNTLNKTVYKDEDAAWSVYADVLRVRSNKKFSVWISTGGFSFQTNATYQYVIVYSS